MKRIRLAAAGLIASAAFFVGLPAHAQVSVSGPIAAGGAVDSTNARHFPVMLGAKDGSGNIQYLLADTDGTLHTTATISGSVTVSSGVAQGSTTSGQVGPLTQGAVTTASPSYTTGQTSPLSLTPSGELRIATIRLNGAAIDLGNGTTGSGTQRVTLSSDSTGSVNVATMNGVAVTMGNGVAGTGVQRVAIASDNTAFSVNAVQSGSWSLAANQSVNVAQMNGVTVTMGNGVAGTGVQRVAIASDNTAFTVNATAAGDVASGSSDSGNPVKIGVVGKSADPTAVTNGQRANLYADLNGKLIVLPYALPANFILGTVNTTGTSAQTIVAAQGSGIKYYCTTLSLANTGSTATLATITGSGTLWTTIVPAGGGSNITFPVPIVTAANTALQVTFASASTTCYAAAAGYDAP